MAKVISLDIRRREQKARIHLALEEDRKTSKRDQRLMKLIQFLASWQDGEWEWSHPHYGQFFVSRHMSSGNWARFNLYHICHKEDGSKILRYFTALQRSMRPPVIYYSTGYDGIMEGDPAICRSHAWYGVILLEDMPRDEWLQWMSSLWALRQESLGC